MTALHIYTAGKQPATRFVDAVGEKSFKCGYAPRRQIRCHDCHRLRWAANLTVQVYYDHTRFACVDKAKCKKARKPATRRKP